jgi:hypothetical protein
MSSGDRRRSEGGNAPAPSQFSRKNSLNNTALRFKATIPRGGKYSEDYIMKVLVANIHTTLFIPLSYQVRRTKDSLFAEDYTVAERLVTVNKKI